MVEEGFIDEFYNFRCLIKDKDIEMSEISTLPIGFTLLDQLEDKYEEGLSWADRDRNIFTFWKEFLGANRKYIKNQRTYQKSKLPDFVNLNLDRWCDSELADKINNHLQGNNNLVIEDIIQNEILKSSENEQLNDTDYLQLIDVLERDYEHYYF